MPNFAQPARTRISPAFATAALLLALNLLNYIDRYILAGEVSPIKNEFHLSDQQMGALGTAFFVFYMIAAPLTGWLGDRFQRKPMIITGAILWSVATLAALWVHSYTTLYLRQALVGIGEATFGIFAPAVLSDFYPEREPQPRVLSGFLYCHSCRRGARLSRRGADWLTTGAGARRSSFALCRGFWSQRFMVGSGASRFAAQAITSRQI